MSPANRPFAAIVFDLDGTLVDSIADIADGANKALAALGRPPRSVADYHKLYVRGRGGCACDRRNGYFFPLGGGRGGGAPARPV